MGIGTGIVLFVIGAILEFALNVQVSWIDLHLVGYILMIAGAVVFLLSLILLLVRRGRRTVPPTTDEDLL
ncbi:DUF6458 family protein [Microbacterium sp. 2MCAF23]|jgi:hypothetical protein|uniref:DUF6458 family protein n=1 Tax=Microbacterium sp. 2MCAF23 TaxID=3232985 RepID=UPI003F9B399F